MVMQRPDDLRAPSSPQFRSRGVCLINSALITHSQLRPFVRYPSKYKVGRPGPFEIGDNARDLLVHGLPPIRVPHNGCALILRRRVASRLGLLPGTTSSRLRPQTTQRRSRRWSTLLRFLRPLPLPSPRGRPCPTPH